MTLDPSSSAAPLFRSFWIGGYEGADHLNSRGEEVAMNLRNGHAQRRDEDYALLARLGIRTIRESIGWRSFAALGVQAGRRELVRTAQLAARHGLQVIWTLHHYGVPDAVDLFAADFPPRFADFCDVVARSLHDVADLADGPLVFQPVNEISFLSWAASSTALMHPFLPRQPDATERAHALKCNLVRAALRGTDALWATWPDARIVHNDPLIHVVPATESVHNDPAVHALHGDPAAWALQAQSLDDAQYEAWDMLCGRREPSLGGAPRYLDVLGLNYYHSNQWEHPTNERLHWHVRDPRRRDLADMLAGIWQRYGRPLFIAETGHVGDGRAQWIDEVATAAQRCRIANVPLEGICLYPLVDRPDWEDTRRWHRSGLWDVERRSGDRQIHLPSLRRLLHWQAHHTPNASRLSPLSSTQPHSSGSPMTPTLIVFSHLRWDFVYQRPQQLLSRLAQHFHVVFVEEPMPGAAHAVLEKLSPCDGVTVLRPHLAGTATGFHDDHIPQLQMLLAQHLEASGTGDYWLWFYTPMAMPLAAGLQPVGVVYDCMDELSAFRHAPRQLLQRESALFHMADLVFTGGQSLYESKRERHADTHCFPSSVDAGHFSQPSRGDADHPAQTGIARPRLGYCGVIDERIDLSLFAALADAHPEWQIVAVGPVVKIDRAALPQRDNIHWLGQRSYQELPELIAGWDVCLMPFALNEATRYISPTKTLEYMAAGKPIVSTPIRDVVGPYAGLVGIADDAQAFVRACEDMLALDDAGRARQAAAREAVLQSTSWDRTADQMAVLMALTADKKRQARPAPATARTQPAASRTDSDGHARHPIIILGAGPTGLAAALHAGQDALLVEQNDTVGGWCRSIEDKGFTFDCAGHIMFSTDPYVLALYERLLGDNLHWQNREAWIYSKEVYTRYPFQSALHGLPPDVLKECLVGAIEARFGSLDKPALRVSPTGPSRAAALPAATAQPAAPTATAAPAALLAAPPPAVAPRNFEEFIYKVWGKGVAKHFAIPYNRKLWAVPLSDMETSWLGGRVPMPDLDEMIEGALQPVHKPIGPNARFGYPLRGGFQALMNGFLPLLEGPLALGTRVTAVSPSRKTVSFDDGRTVAFDTLINTMPLPRLVEAIGAEAPAFVREAARQLRHVSVRCVNLGVARENITDKHWIYYPEDTVFHRVFVQGNASPHCNAPGGFGLTCEITYSPSKPLPAEGQALIQRCIDDAVSVGLLRPDDAIVCANEVDMPIAYVVYDHARAAHVEAIRSWLADAGILLAGRYSEWAYYNSDHAFVAGHKAAEAALKLNADAAPRAVAAAA